MTRPVIRPLDTLAAAALAAVVGIAVAAPGALVAVQLARGLLGATRPAISAGGAVLWIESIGVAAGIAAIATVLAWPAAWALRARPRLWTPLVAVPLLLPPYLAYSGWGLARAPGTWLGDWLARGPGQGPNWWLPLAGKALAVIGLALWAWPGAALVMAASLRRVDQSVLDAARLEPMSLARAARFRAGLLRRGLTAGAALVCLVMLGSAVPLHVAQLETAAIRTWRLLDQTPPQRHWEVWLAAWPFLALAVAGAWVVCARGIRDADAGAVREAPTRRAPCAGLLAAAALGASAAVPLALFAFSLGSAAALVKFVRVEGDAIASSAGVAAAAGSLAALCAAAASWAGSGRGRPAAALLTGALAASCLLPGILVGQATLGAWLAFWPSGADTRWPLVFSHVARFGVVGAWIGLAAAASEPAERRDLRRLDGAAGLRGWARACLADHWPLLLAGGVAVAALSLHEIEAAVVVAPPGARILARDMLGFLHFFRQKELSAGAVFLTVAGLAAGAVAMAAGRTSRTQPWRLPN